MPTLYLHCAICGRKQAGGLLSASGWQLAPLPGNVAVEHPAVDNASVRACPTCIGRDADWAEAARASVGAG